MKTTTNPETLNPKAYTPAPKSQILSRKGLEFRAQASGFPVLGFALGFKVSGLGLRVLDFKVKDWRFGFRIEGCRARET